MSLWENEESVRERLIQRILIGIGAAAAIGVVFWILHNAASLVTRPRNGVGFASSDREKRLMDGMEAPDASTASARTGTLSPAAPGRSYSAPRNIAPPRAYAPLVVPPPPATSNAPLLTPSERVTARMALVPLQQALVSIKDFDRQSFWNGGDIVMRRNIRIRPGTDAALNAEETAPPGSALAVDDATDALGAMVALYGHPDRFPEPVRNDVGIAATAMRSYLKLTMDAATTNDPSDRQRLRPIAEKRLNESTTALQQVEAAANGGIGHFSVGVAR